MSRKWALSLVGIVGTLLLLSAVSLMTPGLGMGRRIVATLLLSVGILLKVVRWEAEP